MCVTACVCVSECVMMQIKLKNSLSTNREKTEAGVNNDLHDHGDDGADSWCDLEFAGAGAIAA